MKNSFFFSNTNLRYSVKIDSLYTYENLIKFVVLILLIFGGLLANAQESQNTVLNKFQSGNYTIYKLGDKNKFEKIKKQWPVEITKQGDNVAKVLVKRAGILDELFVPDVPGYPAYFAYKTFRLSFIKDYAVYYEWNGKEQATTKYVLVKSSGNFNLDFETVNKQVADYAKATFKMQTTARADVKVEKFAIAEVERKANSIQGKTVSKIEIQLISKPHKIAHFSEAIKYGIVATLKDGSQLKTPNLGGKIPWEDFKLLHKGCSNTIEEVRVDEDASSLTEDAIILNVTSVYKSSLKSSKSINTTNNVSIRVNQNGYWGYDRYKHMRVFGAGAGGSGDNLTVKVISVIHKNTGARINKIEIYNDTENKKIAQYKLTPSTELIINTKGGQGQKGSKGSKSSNRGDDGGNGGNGGNVIIIKDPSVTEVNITVNNNGGQGGNGGVPYYQSGVKGNVGNAGAHGKKITKVERVNLSF